jgi:hypothetical protein
MIEGGATFATGWQISLGSDRKVSIQLEEVSRAGGFMANGKARAVEASSWPLIRLLVLILVSTAVGCVIFSGSSMAQGTMNPQQQEIIRTVLRPDGYLTEKQHQQFWLPLKAQIKTADDMAAFRKTVDLDIGSAIKFQREVWKSIDLSQRAGKVTRTPDYEQAKSGLLSAGTGPKESSSGIDEAERMFVAVANKAAYQSRQGPMYLNEEHVQKVLGGLDSAVCRLRRLTDSDWSTKKQEFRYANAHLKILSECPMPIEFGEVTTDDGTKVKMAMLSMYVSENEYISISFTPLKGKWTDPNGSLIRAAQTSLSSFGVQGAPATVQDWRGMKAASASGSLKLSKGSISAAVRVVEAKNVAGSWALFAGSQASLPDALSALAEIEQNVMLD